ncbi:MAG: putative CoA-binding protein [Janthinobacterium sp.]|jgi:predicted CoA-binding protein
MPYKTEMTDIARILKQSRTIAVVGLSCKPHRTSYQVAQYLQAHGYRVIPVNPSYAGTDILGEHCHATLQDAALALGATRIDIVDCFRKAQDIAPVAQAAIDIKAGCLWMQLGISDPVSGDLASAAGLDVVMNRCTKIELSHLPH